MTKNLEEILTKLRQGGFMSLSLEERKAVGFCGKECRIQRNREKRQRYTRRQQRKRKAICLIVPFSMILLTLCTIRPAISMIILLNVVREMLG